MCSEQDGLPASAASCIHQSTQYAMSHCECITGEQRYEHVSAQRSSLVQHQSSKALSAKPPHHVKVKTAQRKRLQHAALDVPQGEVRQAALPLGCITFTQSVPPQGRREALSTPCEAQY